MYKENNVGTVIVPLIFRPKGLAAVGVVRDNDSL